MKTETFEAMPLAEPLHRALREQGYDTPSPIQVKAIPPQLEGRDIMGCAQTGTGKTAAFALPILHHLAKRDSRPGAKEARTLVLTPTRELAVQVGKSFEIYGKYLNLRHALVYGGVGQNPQVRAMASGVDILVATPGRLLDLVGQGYISLKKVEFLVLDEVDRMLDMGFVHDVRRIADLMPNDRQTALFSATITREVEQIAKDFVRNPVRVSISPDMPVVERIRQSVCHVDGSNKLSLLELILSRPEETNRSPRTIIFSRTRHGADKLSKKLNSRGLRSDAIHGNKSQNARQRALDQFKQGRVPILVATDVAARGIDVKDIGLVVNFDMPDTPDTYVHRIGRTARAEADGQAVTFVGSDDISDFRAIERHIGLAIEIDAEHPFHDINVATSTSKGSKAAGRKGGNRGRPAAGKQQNHRRGNFGGRRRRRAPGAV